MFKPKPEPNWTAASLDGSLMFDDVKDVGDTEPAKAGGSGIQNTGKASKGGEMEKKKHQGNGKKGNAQQQVTATIYHCVL